MLNKITVLILFIISIQLLSYNLPFYGAENLYIKKTKGNYSSVQLKIEPLGASKTENSDKEEAKSTPKKNDKTDDITSASKESSKNSTINIIIDKKGDLSKLESHFVILGDLFLGSEKRLTKFCEKYNISTTKTHLELINDSPVIVYGSTEKSETAPQIALYKKNQTPAFVNIEFDKSTIKILFLEYKNVLQKWSFPSKIIVIKDGKESSLFFKNILLK
ncbi:hypothetical protein JXR93_00830 [bacterium]|nr:hypothetical protein [bacterium]